MSVPVQIMVVEDNPADILLLKEALRHHAVEFVLQTYSNGEDAATAISGLTAPPDLIILDINVPRIDGLELLRLVRSTPAVADARVAILTSSQAASDRRHAADLRADAYLIKPSGYHEFLATVGGPILEMVRRRQGPETASHCRHRRHHQGRIISSVGSRVVPSFASQPTAAAKRTNQSSLGLMRFIALG